MDYWGLTVPDDEEEDSAAGTAPSGNTPIMPLLKDIRKSHSLLGLDIGGTLAKLVIALPDDEKDSSIETSIEAQVQDPAAVEAATASTRLRNIPPTFGATGQCPPELAFRATLCGRAWRLQFLRGATQLLGGLQLPATSASPSDPAGLRQVVAAGGGAHKFKALFRSSLGIELVALKEFQSLVDGLRFLHAQRPAGELYTVVPDSSDDSKEGANPESSASTEPEKSHTSSDASATPPLSVSGTVASASDSTANHDSAASTSEEPGKLPQQARPPQAPPISPSPRWVEEEVSWPSPLYPFLLVSFGSGVSVLQVNSAAEADFERVGGTATGGATFLGLMHLLTGKPSLSFDDAVACAARGNAANVDKLVGDIYGADGCANLGLPPTMTAANFGKVAAVRESAPPASNSSASSSSNSTRNNGSNNSRSSSSGRSNSEDSGTGDDQEWPPSEADVAAATLQMIAQASAVLVRTIAQQAKCLTRVFVVGGFMDANPLARAAFAQNLSALKGRALFVAHSGFLGALGSLQRCAADYSADYGNSSGSGNSGSSGGSNNSGDSAVGSPSRSGMRRQLDPASYPWDLGVVTTTTTTSSANDDDEHNGSRAQQERVWTGTWVRPVTCPTSHAAQQGATTSTSTPVSDVLCDANAWWQLGMLWAYAASAAQLRHLVEDQILHRRHRSSSKDYGDDRTGTNIPKGGAAAIPVPFPEHASTHHQAATEDQQQRKDPTPNTATTSAATTSSGESFQPPSPGCGCGLCRDWRWSEAQRCLDKCAQLEPRCTLAFWALAWTHGHKPLHADDDGDADGDVSNQESGSHSSKLERSKNSSKNSSSESNNGSSNGADSSGAFNNSPSLHNNSSQAHGECLLSYEGAHFAGRRALALVRTQQQSPSASGVRRVATMGADSEHRSTCASAGAGAGASSHKAGGADGSSIVVDKTGNIDAAAQMEGAEAALVEATALRFAVWPPSTFATHLNLAFAAAVTEAQQQHPNDPDIAAVAIHARFDTRVASLRTQSRVLEREVNAVVGMNSADGVAQEWDAAVVDAVKALEKAHAQHPTHAGLLLMLHALLPALTAGTPPPPVDSSISHPEVARASTLTESEALLLLPGSIPRAVWAKGRQNEVATAITAQAPHSAVLLLEPHGTSTNFTASGNRESTGNSGKRESGQTDGSKFSSRGNNDGGSGAPEAVNRSTFQGHNSAKVDEPAHGQSNAREDRDAAGSLTPSMVSLHANSGRIRGMSYGAVD